MNRTYCTVATVAVPSLRSTNRNPQNALPYPLLLRNSNPFLFLNLAKNRNKRTIIALRIRVSASSDNINSNDGGTGNWVNRLPIGALSADKVLRLVAGATASPIGQYVAEPFTFLHSVDPRIKLVMVLFF